MFRVGNHLELALTIDDVPHVCPQAFDADDFVVFDNDFFEGFAAQNFNAFFFGLRDLIERGAHAAADNLHFGLT